MANLAHRHLCLHVREKGRDLTLSYDKKPYTDRKIHVFQMKWWPIYGCHPFLIVKFANLIKAFTLRMLATFWIRCPSKIRPLHTFNTRSRHAFPIAIPDSFICFQNLRLQSKFAATGLPRSFLGSPNLQLLRFTISVRSMWPHSDRWSQ